MSNFWKRTITGVIFVAVLLTAILHPVSCALLFGLLAILAANEFYNITRNDQDSHVNKIGGLVFASLLLISEITTILYHNYYILDFSIYAISIIIAFFFFLIIFELFRNKGNALKNWAYLVMGQIFFVWPWVLAILLPYINSYFEYNYKILYALFFAIWLNDTCAYLCGFSFGKHKFFERISPKKTWEGFVGGAFFTIAISTIVFPYIFEKDWIYWLIFSTLVVIFGTLGDLMESLIKRSVGVKDSGNILPGHGGILDRFDSFMLAAPIIFIFCAILH